MDKCSIDACELSVYARGWCCKHYKHWHRFGDPLPKNRRPGGVGRPGGTCSIDGCEEPYHCRTWCKGHYDRWRRNKDPLAGNRSGRSRGIIKTDRDAPPGHRHCLKCNYVKPLDEFHRDRTKVDGATFYCKVCNKGYTDAQRARDPEKYLERVRRSAYRHVLKKHGMTFDDYDAMLARQGGACKICKRPETVLCPSGVVKMMALDHDHVTGRVRGLLCSACNQGLGAFQDDVSRLTAAIEYLLVAAP